MTEKWIEGVVHKSTGEPIADGKSLESANGERIKIVLASGTANAITIIPHNLGRIPQSVRIVNMVLAAAADVVWYRLRTDNPWDEQAIEVRFRFDDADVFLEVT
ncbi:MAG: hypothetical protein J3T61_12100 [Candidatus Brocadiales bacterium]|nr:hypothetical protein [Candidatus Bathyanammoxibius sp.]